MTNETSEETHQQKAAWEYYQHADNLQHSRHNIFIVAQSIFFTAYATASKDVAVWPVIVALGIVTGVLWLCLSERLYAGMKALSEGYLEPNEKKKVTGDPIYGEYLSALAKSRLPSGRFILNIALPGITVAAWLVLLALRKCA